VEDGVGEPLRRLRPLRRWLRTVFVDSASVPLARFLLGLRAVPESLVCGTESDRDPVVDGTFKGVRQPWALSPVTDTSERADDRVRP
jgi:hypothetical protein